jgi:hypothetical protein
LVVFNNFVGPGPTGATVKTASGSPLIVSAPIFFFKLNNFRWLFSHFFCLSNHWFHKLNNIYFGGGGGGGIFLIGSSFGRQFYSSDFYIPVHFLIIPLELGLRE